MKGYKEIITKVPASAKWYTVDVDGSAYVSRGEPKYNELTGMWSAPRGDHMIQVGEGPNPKDASKELYRI